MVSRGTIGCRALHKDAHLLVINNAQEHYAVAGMLASVNRQYRFVLLYFFISGCEVRLTNSTEDNI